MLMDYLFYSMTSSQFRPNVTKISTVLIITTTIYCNRYIPHSRLRLSPFFWSYPPRTLYVSTEFPPILLCAFHLQSPLQVILIFGHSSRIMVKDGMMVI